MGPSAEHRRVGLHAAWERTGARSPAIRGLLAGRYDEVRQRVRDARPEVVIVTAVHDCAATLRRTLESALSQRGIGGRWLMLVIDDGSTDNGLASIADLARGAPVLALRTRRRGVVATRNHLLALSRCAPSRALTIRLDGDDTFGDDTTVFRVQRAFRRSCFSLRCGLRRSPDALLASNLQTRGGIEVGRNLADGRLLEAKQLLARIEGMAQGDFSAELPSCNLVLGPAVTLDYPMVTSAEDHWFSVALLLARPRYHLAVEGDILHTAYSLAGQATAANHASRAYGESRRHLLAWARRTLRERS